MSNVNMKPMLSGGQM